MHFASSLCGLQESEPMVNSLYQYAETDSIVRTAAISTEMAKNGWETLSHFQGNFPGNASFDQLEFPRNIEEDIYDFNFAIDDNEFTPRAQDQQTNSDSSCPPSPTFNQISPSFSPQLSIDDFIQSSDEKQNKTHPDAEQESRFLAPIQRLLSYLFYYFLPKLYEKCTQGDRTYERVISQSKCVLEKVTIILPKLLDQGYNVLEIMAATLYIALETTGVGVNNMIKSFYGRELSPLRTFQLFVNAIEVLYKASRHEYHSANPEVKIRSPSFCIDNVVRFLQLCEQIARQILLTSNLENLDSNKMCLEDILSIERHYSDVCTATTSLRLLSNLDIFGRLWYPELLVQMKEEQNEESTQQETNENGQKRRRIDDSSDDYEDEEDNIQQPHEQPLTQKEDDEQTYTQQEEDEMPKKYKNYEDRKNLTDQFRERIIKVTNKKLNDLNEAQFLVSTNQQHEPNNIPQIDASPLSQPFSQECVKLPFYNACRQDELQEVAQKIFQQPNQGKEKKTNIKYPKLKESVKAIGQYQFFSKKGKCTYGEKYAQMNQNEQIQNIIDNKDDDDILGWCFQVSQTIDMQQAMEEEGERRAEHECWKIPDFKSETFNGVKEAVINEMQKLTPKQANKAKKKFETLKSEEGNGKVNMQLSKDLIARGNNISEAQVDIKLKEVFIKKSDLLEQENVTWLLRPEGFGKRSCCRNEYGDDEQESDHEETNDNKNGKNKKKSKRNQKVYEDESEDSDEYKMDMKPVKRKRKRNE